MRVPPPTSGVDSIAISLFGNMTVETREIHIITKEWVSEQKIQIIILILKRGPCLGRTPNGKCHLKFPFWFFEYLPNLHRLCFLKESFMRKLSEWIDRRSQTNIMHPAVWDFVCDMINNLHFWSGQSVIWWKISTLSVRCPFNVHVVSFFF